MENSELKLLLIALVIAGIIGGAWYFRDRVPARESIAPGPAPVAETPTEGRKPLHPVAPLAMPDGPDRDLVTLPALDDSDSYFTLALADLLGPDIEKVLVSESVIDRIVATVDNLPRSHVAEKIRPVTNLSGSFLANPDEGDRRYTLSTDNYGRYDAFVELVARADMDEVAATYRRFYPLFQEAYERLGYPDAYFNDRVIEVIDHLLATPQPEEPILLVRPHVLYEFADADLQALSSGRKLLIRMGSENSATIKQSLQKLRERIAAD